MAFPRSAIVCHSFAGRREGRIGGYMSGFEFVFSLFGLILDLALAEGLD